MSTNDAKSVKIHFKIMRVMMYFTAEFTAAESQKQMYIL